MKRFVFACSALVAIGLGVLLVESGVIEHAFAAPKTPSSKEHAGGGAPNATISPQLLYLVRSTLSTLNDANASGNYAVLRDLAAPSFQARYSTADLAEIFRAARRKPIDLTAALLVAPVLTEVTRPDAGRLTVSGYVVASERRADGRVSFLLQFAAIAGHWRLAGLQIVPD